VHFLWSGLRARIAKLRPFSAISRGIQADLSALQTVWRSKRDSNSRYGFWNPAKGHTCATCTASRINKLHPENWLKSLDALDRPRPLFLVPRFGSLRGCSGFSTPVSTSAWNRSGRLSPTCCRNFSPQSQICHANSFDRPRSRDRFRAPVFFNQCVLLGSDPNAAAKSPDPLVKIDGTTVHVGAAETHVPPVRVPCAEGAVSSPRLLPRPPFVSHIVSTAGSNTGAEREVSQGRILCAA
jgi:hypothetical protein